MVRGTRMALAILAGSLFWALLWNVGTRGAQALWPHLLTGVERISHTGILLLYIGYGALLSILAGFVTASAAGHRPMLAVWILAVLQVGLGIAAEVSYWALMPVWYHVLYLANVVPATVVGGMFAARRIVPAASP